MMPHYENPRSPGSVNGILSVLRRFKGCFMCQHSVTIGVSCARIWFLSSLGCFFQLSMFFKPPVPVWAKCSFFYCSFRSSHAASLMVFVFPNSLLWSPGGNGWTEPLYQIAELHLIIQWAVVLAAGDLGRYLLLLLQAIVYRNIMFALYPIGSSEIRFLAPFYRVYKF